MTNQLKTRLAILRRGEVPEGYQRTKVGVVPEEWEVKQLKKIAEISSGLTPSRQNPSYWNGTIPWITTTQMNEDCILFAKEYISESALKDTSIKMIPKGTILMAMYGQGKTRGMVSMLEIDATINQACAAIQIKKHSEQYVFYVFQQGYDKIRRMSNVGNQENLNGEIVESIAIPLPPISEQQKIATILSTHDKLIELKDQLIAEKQQQKKYLMQQLLTGKKRLDGFDGEWEAGTVRDVLKICSGKDQKLIECVDGCNPILGTGGEIGRTNHYLYGNL